MQKKTKGYRGQPIMFNEGIVSPLIVNALANMGVGSGLYLLGKKDYKTGYQSPPVDWGVTRDLQKLAFFNAVKAL
jgi:hypothetical protein